MSQLVYCQNHPFFAHSGTNHRCSKEWMAECPLILLGAALDENQAFETELEVLRM